MKGHHALLAVFYFTFLLGFSANYKMLRTSSRGRSRALLKSKEGVDFADITKQCMETIMGAIPPEFCWKQGADFGIIPTGCPDGYFRSLALCYEYCGEGYTYVAGVCWEGCPGGFADHGLTCFEHIFHWYFKHAYIPGSLTNFSDMVPCPQGMYRGGALCYRDCRNIGLENCGIGACATDSLVCGAKIGEMVKGVIEGIATAISTAASFGATAAVKAGISQGVKAIGKMAINAVKSRIKGLFASVTKKTIFNRAKKLLKNKVSQYIEVAGQNLLVESFCQGVWDETDRQLSVETPEVDEDTLVKAIDIFNVSGMVADCSDTSGENGALTCATTVVTSLAGFDPTGVLTIAGAFMHPECDVTTDDFRDDDSTEIVRFDQSYFDKLTPEEKESMKVLTETDLYDPAKFDPACIHVWSECYYQGEYYKVCADGDFGNFNDKTQSLYQGINSDSTVFEHMDYSGHYLTFGPGTAITCLKDYKKEEVDLTNLTSSVRFGIGKCYILNFMKPYSYFEGNNYFFCNTEEASIDIPIRDDTEEIDYEDLFRNIGNKLIIMKSYVEGAMIYLYTEANFGGTEKIIEGSKTFINRADFGINYIRSYKVVFPPAA